MLLKDLQESENSDRRYLPRWDVTNKVLYRETDDAVYRESTSKDINASGACICVRDSFDIGDKIILTIHMSKKSPPIHAKGRVVWRVLKDAESLVGIYFEKISEKAKDIIYDYAFEYKKDDLLKLWFEGC